MSPMGAHDFVMPSSARLAALTLRVRDLDRMLVFYRDLLGLTAARADGDATLVPSDEAFALHLAEVPDAPLRPRGAIGLYHFALLLPDRRSLAAVLRRLIESGLPVDGASDHGVSEAVYLPDPEGNGIELYRDRPRSQWPTAWDQVAMVTQPLDLPGLLSEAPRSGPLDPATRLGHIHVHVPDLAAGEGFYAGGLGLNVRQRSYPGALFLAAGDYHHHVGLNTWARRQAPAGATGLLSYEWLAPEDSIGAVEERLREREAVYVTRDGVLRATDPAGIEVVLRPAVKTRPPSPASS